jgi:hypothetical protein
MENDNEEEKNTEDVHPITKFFMYLIIGASSLYMVWATIIAFIGGRIPIFGFEMRGGIISGLIWVFILDPIIMTIMYWISMIIVLPIGLLVSWLSKK